MQTVRQVVHASGNLQSLCPYLGDEPPGFARIGDTHPVEIHGQQRQFLADVVVQLARDQRTLGLLRLEQSRPEVADPLVARMETVLASAQIDFGTVPSRSVNKQRRNQS